MTADELDEWIDRCVVMAKRARQAANVFRSNDFPDEGAYIDANWDTSMARVGTRACDQPAGWAGRLETTPSVRAICLRSIDCSEWLGFWLTLVCTFIDRFAVRSFGSWPARTRGGIKRALRR